MILRRVYLVRASHHSAVPRNVDLTTAETRKLSTLAVLDVVFHSQLPPSALLATVQRSATQCYPTQILELRRVPPFVDGLFESK